MVYLATVLNRDTFHDVLRELYSGINHSGLLNIHYLEGVARLIQRAHPGYLDVDDIVKILDLLSKRLKDTHQQSTQHMHKLTLAVSHVLDAMVDTNVTDLDREKLHQPLQNCLGELKLSSDPYLVYQATYAYQALLCVPDNETIWQTAIRRTGKVLQGISGLVSAVKGFDLHKLIMGLDDIQKGFGGASTVINIVKHAYDDVISCRAEYLDGNRITSGSIDSTVRIWEAGTGECLQILVGHTNWVGDVAYSPQGEQLAPAGYDKIIRLWDVASGKSCATLTGHCDKVTFVTYSPQGDLIASGSWDKTVRLWDVASRECRKEIKYLPGLIWSVAWGPQSDTTYFVTASGNGLVLKWEVMDEEKSIRVRLLWNATNGTLAVTGAVMRGVRGLSSLNKELLKQHGAVGEPETLLRERSKKVATMTSVVSNFEEVVYQDILQPLEDKGDLNADDTKVETSTEFNQASDPQPEQPETPEQPEPPEQPEQPEPPEPPEQPEPEQPETVDDDDLRPRVPANVTKRELPPMLFRSHHPGHVPASNLPQDDAPMLPETARMIVDPSRADVSEDRDAELARVHLEDPIIHQNVASTTSEMDQFADDESMLDMSLDDTNEEAPTEFNQAYDPPPETIDDDGLRPRVPTNVTSPTIQGTL